MSYILEALKKAQAERQLGGAPTIHALPVHVADPGAGGARRKPLWLALSAAALAAVLAVAFWRGQGAAPTPAAPAPIAIAPAPMSVVPAAQPIADRSAVAPPSTSMTVVPEPQPQPVAVARAPASKPEIKPAIKPVAKPVTAPAVAAEELVPALRELPEAIQRTAPKVVFGGYMYSQNPADRLLLIDKVLRHEGEEVAPGLMLEKLLPKAAVMNYKGYRYRVPY